MHKPIQIKNISFVLPHKICFENFNCLIPYGSRIAIIGRNGSGKSTLLQMIAGILSPYGGSIIESRDVIKGYVPQIVEDNLFLSGGQRFNKAMTEALSLNPNVLLLDEPTNHLDSRNKKSLIRMLQNYSGTLIVVSHDKELLRSCIKTLWHIDNGAIHIFSGNYDDYVSEVKLKRTSIERDLEILTRTKREMHFKLMQEQKRASRSKLKGEKQIENRKYTKMVGNLKGMQAEKSQGKKIKNIDANKVNLSNKLANLRLPEIIIPKFAIDSSESSKKLIIQISNGSVGYSADRVLLSGVNITLYGGERIAIVGDNGSGKSTLIKAILADESVCKKGDWQVVKKEDIGYLDQHYSTLLPNKSVFEALSEIVPNWSHAEVRNTLNTFLFRKNEEVEALVNTLSGGEKARLNLAQIAVKTPKVLILDEITNNLDLETKDHVVQVLNSYPGAMIVISHDNDFLEEIKVGERINVQKFIHS